MRTKSYTKDELIRILIIIEKADRPHVLLSFVDVVDNPDDEVILEIQRNYIDFVNDTYKNLIDFDRLSATTLSNEEVWELIESIWTIVEKHYEHTEEWDSLFSARPNLPSLTKTLPNEFTVYRAGDDKGYSWTLDPKKAKWFWIRNNIFNEIRKEKATNDIWTLKVRKKQVFFYTNGRNEEEVVLNPNYIIYLTKEKEKPIKLSEEEIKKIISAL